MGKVAMDVELGGRLNATATVAAAYTPKAILLLSRISSRSPRLNAQRGSRMSVLVRVTVSHVSTAIVGTPDRRVTARTPSLQLRRYCKYRGNVNTDPQSLTLSREAHHRWLSP